MIRNKSENECEVKGVKRYKREWDGDREESERGQRKTGYNGYFIFTVMASLLAVQRIPLLFI